VNQQLLFDTNSINVIICTYNFEPKFVSKKIHQFFLSINKKINLILVSNKKNNQNHSTDKYVYLVGSNSNLDLSAYYEGLLYCKANKIDHLFTIVCNDNIFVKHDFNFSFKSIIKYQKLVLNFTIPSIVGYSSDYTTICLVNPWSNSPNFLPTYFFALNNYGINYYIKLYESTLAISATSNKNDYIFTQKLVPFNLLNLIFAHLNIIDSPLSWHGIKKYSTDNILIQKKMNCVFFEHYISGLFYNDGALIYINTSKKYILTQFIRDFIYRALNKKYLK
jgi:hypothetical protein